MRASSTYLLPCSVLLVFASACESGALPSLAPIAAQSPRVNEELQLAIGVDNPDGRALDVSVTAETELPGFERVHSITSTPSGAQFRWAPLSSHTGTHELTFRLTDPSGATEYDRAVVVFEVMAAADAAPVFVSPGAGGTYDLERDPCVAFDVEVRDDDSSEVTVGVRTELPDGAMLEDVAPKRATFHWCPSPDQVAAAERWTVALFAEDGDHPRVEHDFIVVLRSGPKDGCPGLAPTVSLGSPRAGEVITSGTTYPIEVTVTDDQGLRDPPLLYYTATAPDDPMDPDVTQFEQASFVAVSETEYTARIPSLGLAPGAMQAMHFFVSATDNDDPSGTTCDHRTDTDVVSFFAVGGEPVEGSFRQCDACSASSECASGICAAGAGGGRCVDACSDAVCTAGTCGATVSTEGGTRAGCGPVSEICGGSTACTDDPREPNDTIATASAYSAPITNGQVCPGNPDYVSFSVPQGSRVSVSIDNYVVTSGDLDLELRTSTGSILDTSAGVTNMEQVDYCNADPTRTLYARVFGYGTAQNRYDLTATVAPDAGGCCMADAGENDDAQASARAVSFTTMGASSTAQAEGTWCTGDDDWIQIPMTGPGHISVLVIFQHAMTDIDIAVHGPTGTRLASSTGVTDEESIELDVGAAGMYALRVYGFGAGTDWAAEITRSAGGGCTSTSMCPTGTVCSGGSCISNVCTGSCPSGHTCLSAGPTGSLCGVNCTSNSSCRSGEACKWTASGRGCGIAGTSVTGPNGAPCSSFVTCGGQRTCVAWPGGYCARQGCASQTDCETGTRCINTNGINVCAVHDDCFQDTDCRAGYECWPHTPVGGGAEVWICIPPP